MHGVAEDQPPERAPGEHEEDAGHEEVGRDREELAGLLDPAQVHQRQQHDDADRAERLVLDDEGDRGAEVLHAGGDRHGDGQDVVDQQGAGDGQSGPGAEVGGGDLVVAAAARVGADVLPVGGDDREHQDHDGERDPRAEVVRRHARDGQDEEHLSRCVRHRGQRVGCEDGERDALGEEGLPQLVAAQRPADQDPFGHVGQFGHAEDRKRSPYRSRPPDRRGTPPLLRREQKSAGILNAILATGAALLLHPLPMCPRATHDSDGDSGPPAGISSSPGNAEGRCPVVCPAS